mmetsp:Transcript_2113/g.2872  ORF Transcript_2113/g.2872 Transcript_2113/m.2872 type:complete len:343 (+) Transcript_2113:123-1151(+)
MRKPMYQITRFHFSKSFLLNLEFLQVDAGVYQGRSKDELSVSYSCKFCGNTHLSEVDLHVHYETCHEPLIMESVQNDEHGKNEEKFPYPCEICMKRFKSNYGLQSHRHDSHECKYTGDEKIFPCSVCRRIFKTPVGLQAHERDSHHTKSSNSLLTPQEDENNLNQDPHSEFVSTKAIFTIPCNICQKLFKTSLDLQAHQRDAHNLIQPEDLRTNDAPIPCTQCRRVFKTTFGLRAHERDAHSVNKILTMSIEDNVINNEAKHTGKMIKLPNGTVTCKHIPCTQCAKVFRTERNLHLHVKTVHSGAKIQCESCGKFLSSLVAMEQHTKAKHMAQEFIVAEKSD